MAMAVSGAYFSNIDFFSFIAAALLTPERYEPTFLAQSWSASLTSFIITEYEATASLDSEVNGTQTEIMCTNIATGASGSLSPLRPYLFQSTWETALVMAQSPAW